VGRDHLGGLGINERIQLTLFFKKQNFRMWTGFIWLRMASTGEFL